MDDVWAPHRPEPSGPNADASSWLPRVDSAWSEIGVQSHPGKAVDCAAGEEIQGGFVHPVDHTVSLKPEKMADLMCMVFWLLTSYTCSTRAVARVVGKVGFAHTFRPSMRFSFGETYRWLDLMRERGIAACMLPLQVAGLVWAITVVSSQRRCN